MASISSRHFLSLPRPDVFVGHPPGVVDTTTLAAHDYDVDTRTGFMPPQAPLSRLPKDWEPWEAILEDAVRLRLQLGDKHDLAEGERIKSETWRDHVRKLSILPILGLKKSELTLRRAHHVLGWIMHFYIHSLPPNTPIRIPPPVTVPLLQVSAQLQLPPVLTYSDDVLYNWFIPDSDEIPTATSPLRCQTLFTSTNDEAEFYLVSARMELKGVDALELMRSTMDEAFVGDDIAARRITTYLRELANVIRELAVMLMRVKDGCDPDVFYQDVRPWFQGEDSKSGQKWIFEGLELDSTLTEPTELSGPSAGQSSIIHALDAFLGVDKYSHSKELTGSTSQTCKSAFLQRMQLYMPRHHRAFLTHLANNPRPLREVVLSKSSEHPALLEAYNESVQALKEFRDQHMIIVALYIVGPAKRLRESKRLRAAETAREDGVEEDAARRPLKGTGGTDLVQFLKGVRDQTRAALLPLPATPTGCIMSGTL